MSNELYNDGLKAYEKVLSLMEKHHEWLSQSLPMIASENVPSPAVREALTCDFGNRYAEGWPGERVYAGCKFIDEVELLAVELAKKVYQAEFADVRPVSGVVANLITYTAFAEPGDIMYAVSIPHGGHISHGKKKIGGTAGSVRGLEVMTYPFDEENFNIDVDATKRQVMELKASGRPPKLFMLGASVFLFPHPVKEIVEIAKEVDAYVVYDAAHVAGLIAGGLFQDPLREGADIVTGSTHKTLPGPQGGIILSKLLFAERIKKATFPGNVSNHHLHHVAGKAVVFAEMLAFGKEYARAVIKNAKALAEALSERGITVLGERNGFTKSHQVLLDVTKYGDGGTLEEKLERANIIVNRNMIPGDIKAGRHYMHPGGIRMGVQEVTRLGMGKGEMIEIAEMIADVIVRRKDPQLVAKRVVELRKGFQTIKYAFDTAAEAYRYIELRKVVSK